MKRLHVQLMGVTSLLLALAVAISLAVLYTIGLATARAGTLRSLASGLRLAEGVAASAAGAATDGPRAEAWQAQTGGTLEVAGPSGQVLWRVGPALPLAGVPRPGSGPWLDRPGPGGRLLSIVRLRSAAVGAGLRVAAEAPVRAPAFPGPQEVGVIFAGLASLAVAQVLWALVARRLAGRLTQLAELTRRYARGEFRLRPDIRSPREVAQLAEAMADMAEALSRERQAREAFLAEVAHDLRTPLTALRATLGSLSASAEPATAGRLALAAREAERLTRLVNDLLDLARYESGHLAVPVAPVDLREIAVLAAATGEAAAESRGLALHVELPPDPVPVRADLDRGAQVLVNLLDNAVRYTPPPGDVFLTVGRDGGSGVVRVEDTGPGFAPDAAAWAWSAFVRGKGARENDGGTGLGLAVARALAQAMGGGLRILAPDGRRRGRVELRLQSAAEGSAQEGTP